MQRHGYKGGLEFAATVDYIFGFDATAHIVPDFVYEGLAEHALSPRCASFLRHANPWALNAIAERLLEAAQRELWEQPNPETLEALREVAVADRDGTRSARRTEKDAGMKRENYPFSAIVGLPEMKLALLLSAVRLATERAIAGRQRRRQKHGGAGYRRSAPRRIPVRQSCR